MIFDYYKLLGIAASASAAEIKQAYRRLARQYHPDLNAQTRDELNAQKRDEQIKRLNEAYEILSNARKRAAYDNLLHQTRLRAEEAHAQRQRERREAEKTGEPEMTWMEGVFGFVRELRKGMRDD